MQSAKVIIIIMYNKVIVAINSCFKIAILLKVHGKLEMFIAQNSSSSHNVSSFFFSQPSAVT